MNKNVLYPMQSDAPDPRNSGDTHSWFFFYKWRAGETWVPAKEGSADAEEGDWIWFTMDRYVLGAAKVTQVVDRNLQGERELHFDSDSIMVPQAWCTVGYDNEPLVWSGVMQLARPLSEFPQGEEPSWLKSLLTRKHP